MSDTCNVRDCERQVEYVLTASPDRRTGSLGARLCAVHYARKHELLYLDDGAIVGQRLVDGRGLPGEAR